jgi:hypothetical protein
VKRATRLKKAAQLKLKRYQEAADRWLKREQKKLDAS